MTGLMTGLMTGRPHVSAPTRGVDHELYVGSHAHYADPAYYAQAYVKRVDDVARYLELAREFGGPVLEYGCGAGRITVPIARAGIEITGVDHAPAMLGALERSRAAEPPEVRARLRVKRGDMRTMRLRGRFPLVIAPFNTLLHLYTRDDVERFLSRARAHLTTRGRLAFDVNVPAHDDLLRDPSRLHTIRPFRHPTLGVRVRYGERFDYDPIRQVLFVSMEFTPDRGEGWTTPLAHRQFFPEELAALLHYNGFAVERREGGFRHEPVDRHADSLLWICRPRRPWRPS